jgi:Tol biopolymer transport system component
VGACDWSVVLPRLGVAESLGAPNTARSEIDPVVSRDGLRLYYVAYTSNTSGNDIVIATRSSVSADFGAGAVLALASTNSNDMHFFESDSGLEAFLSSDRAPTVGGADIFHATRARTTDTWGTFVSAANVNSATGDFDPHLEADGLTLWFDPIGRSDGTGLQDIYYARRTGASAEFGNPVPATVLNSTANDWNVSLTTDGLVLVFQSDRGASPHVYYAIRSNRSSSFGAPMVLAALDPYMTTLSDPFVSPDGCAVYFAAQLSGGSGLSDLYAIRAK